LRYAPTKIAIQTYFPTKAVPPNQTEGGPGFCFYYRLYACFLFPFDQLFEYNKL
jgi:hypothetical protein